MKKFVGSKKGKTHYLSVFVSANMMLPLHGKKSLLYYFLDRKKDHTSKQIWCTVYKSYTTRLLVLAISLHVHFQNC